MTKLNSRKAKISDVNIYYKWINDELVRENSFNSNIIKWEDHFKWFEEKINNPNYYFYLFQDANNNLIGQVRIEKINEIESLVGISISFEHRGFGYGPIILTEACNEFFKSNSNFIINAYIKNENISSKNIFEKAGFHWLNKVLYNNFNTDHYILYADR